MSLNFSTPFPSFLYRCVFTPVCTNHYRRASSQLSVAFEGAERHWCFQNTIVEALNLGAAVLRTTSRTQFQDSQAAFDFTLYLVNAQVQ